MKLKSVIFSYTLLETLALQVYFYKIYNVLCLQFTCTIIDTLRVKSMQPNRLIFSNLASESKLIRPNNETKLS